MKKTTLGILASLLISMTAQAELVNLDFENQYCDAGEESKSFGIVTFSKTKEEGAFFCAQQGRKEEITQLIIHLCFCISFVSILIPMVVLHISLRSTSSTCD